VRRTIEAGHKVGRAGGRAPVAVHSIARRSACVSSNSLYRRSQRRCADESNRQVATTCVSKSHRHFIASNRLGGWSFTTRMRGRQWLDLVAGCKRTSYLRFSLATMQAFFSVYTHWCVCVYIYIYIYIALYIYNPRKACTENIGHLRFINVGYFIIGVILHKSLTSLCFCTFSWFVRGIFTRIDFNNIGRRQVFEFDSANNARLGSWPIHTENDLYIRWLPWFENTRY